MVRVLSLTLILVLSLPASAEYRAYELAIRNIDKGTERKVISTLDHIQYAAYYPLAKNEVAVYVTSWMCWGRTSSFKPTCPNWKANQPEQKPKLSSPGPGGAAQPTGA